MMRDRRSRRRLSGPISTTSKKEPARSLCGARSGHSITAHYANNLGFAFYDDALCSVLVAASPYLNHGDMEAIDVKRIRFSPAALRKSEELNE
jgi:hypothetical protein